MKPYRFYAVDVKLKDGTVADTILVEALDEFEAVEHAGIIFGILCRLGHVTFNMSDSTPVVRDPTKEELDKYSTTRIQNPLTKH